MTPEERKSALEQLKTLRKEMRGAMKAHNNELLKEKFAARKAVFATLKAARKTK